MKSFFALDIIILLSLFLAQVVLGQSLKVEDFGAVADGMTDCTGAFIKAFACAGQKGPGVTIELGKGRYLLSSKFPQDLAQKQDVSHLEGEDKESYEVGKQINIYKVPPCIKVDDIHVVTVAGAGVETEIIVNYPMAGTFQLWNCSNVIMQDFCIDYDPLPFTQGTIIDVDQAAGTFDYKIDEDFPVLSEYWFLKADCRMGVVFDENRLFRQGGITALYCKDWKKLSDFIWRMNMVYPGQTKGLQRGDRYIHTARTHNPALGFYRCKNVKLYNVHIYTAPCSAIIFYQCDGNLHVNSLQIKPRPGSGRIFSLSGDCVHSQSCRKGPLIENCVFEGMSDDGLNIYGPPSVINEILAPDKVRISDPHVLQKDDLIQIIRPKSGLIQKEGIRIAAVEDDVITLANAVKGLKAGRNHVIGDTIFNLSACGSGYIIRNNIIGGFRGRGILSRAHNGLIENNLIRDTSGQGIVIYNEPDWPEGPIPSDVIIRNNTLIGVNRDDQQQMCGAIQLAAQKLRYKTADLPGFKNVFIENNLIIDPPGNAIFLQGISCAKITGNIVQLTDNDRPIVEYCGIRLENCEDVMIDGFAVVDQWARVSAGLYLDGTPRDQVTLENINIDVSNNGQLIVEK